MEEAEIEKQLVEINTPVRLRLKQLFGQPREPKEVYGLLSEFLSSEGKLLRPALCLLSCEAAGGKREDAAPAAAAIEMFHNFTLIHDDIEDSSEMRRGKPCLHVKYGLPLALNAGDGLFMMVWRQALQLQGPRKERAQLLLLSAFTKVLEGQAVELGWYKNNRWDIDERAYTSVVEGKTGALIAASCEVGGLLGGADEKTCRALSVFGRGIGVGFQIVDDVLNITGNEKIYGKEIGGDVREGKRTLLTIEALRVLEGRNRERLAGILKKKNKTASDVGAAVSLLKESGAPQVALRAAEAEIDRALEGLGTLPKNAAREMLAELAVYITRRKR